MNVQCRLLDTGCCHRGNTNMHGNGNGNSNSSNNFWPKFQVKCILNSLNRSTAAAATTALGLTSPSVFLYNFEIKNVDPKNSSNSMEMYKCINRYFKFFFFLILYFILC